MNATDCVVMYEMNRDSGTDDETSLYFNKIRAYSDFALDIPYNPTKIREDMAAFISSLSEYDTAGLKTQLAHVAEDLTKYTL